MKFAVLLGLLATRFAATETWNDDGYADETLSSLGWLGYLKRLALIALMLSGVVLYYVPEARSLARRACYIMIDLAADSLKSALSPYEGGSVYGRIRSDPRERLRCGVKSSDDREGSTRGQESRETGSWPSSRDKRERHRRRSHRRHRDSIIKDDSVDPYAEDERPGNSCPDRFGELRSYLKSRLRRVEGFDTATVENYAFLISGNPRQMAMLDQTHENDGLVVLPDACQNMRYKECGTSTDKFSVQLENDKCLTYEEPTKETNYVLSNTRTDGYNYDEITSSSVPDADITKYSQFQSAYHSDKIQWRGDCSINCSPHSPHSNDRRIVDTLSHIATKVPQNTMSRKKVECFEGDLCKSQNRRNFPEIGQVYDVRMNSTQKTGKPHVSSSKKVYKTKPTGGGKVSGICCNDSLRYADQGMEADDENSQLGQRVTERHSLDERPQRENHVFFKSSDDEMFFDYDYAEAPILTNQAKPGLLRAVNWIFGGCPEASRRGKIGVEGSDVVGKEEIEEVTDGWLR